MNAQHSVAMSTNVVFDYANFRRSRSACKNSHFRNRFANSCTKRSTHLSSPHTREHFCNGLGYRQTVSSLIPAESAKKAGMSVEGLAVPQVSVFNMFHYVAKHLAISLCQSDGFIMANIALNGGKVISTYVF